MKNADFYKEMAVKARDEKKRLIEIAADNVIDTIQTFMHEAAAKGRFSVSCNLNDLCSYDDREIGIKTFDVQSKVEQILTENKFKTSRNSGVFTISWE